MESKQPEKLSPGGHNRKLSMDQASEIKRRLREGESQTLLGKEFGITQAQVWRIKEGSTYVEGLNNHQRMVHETQLQSRTLSSRM
jgi:DNA invertase Pin-like site-specific DNA recombinase